MRSLVLVAMSALALTACAHDERDDTATPATPSPDATCRTDYDCAFAQACDTRSGRCLPRDLPDMRRPHTTDAGVSTSDLPAQRDLPTSTDFDPNDIDRDDVTPPEIVTIRPDPSAGELAPEATFEIVFSEPLREFTVNVAVIYLRDARNAKVPASVTYDPASRTARLVPDMPLSPASPYRLTIEPFVQDLAFNKLASERVVTYASRYDEQPAVRGLVERWAPALYQEVRDPNAWREDWPTRFTFDGDIDASNNLAALSDGALLTRAQVYYLFAETSTHYLIHYILYYPRRHDPSAGVDAEHDLSGVLLVVDKARDRVVLAEGVYVSEVGETSIRFGPEGLVPASRTAGVPVHTWAADALSGATERYPLYITPGVHEGCNWIVAGQPTPALCRHDASAFRGTHGALLEPNAQGSTYPETAATGVSEGLRRGSYELVPLVRDFWARRTYGSGQPFDIPFTYSPEGGRPASDRPDASFVLPKNLRSDAPVKFGRTPFQWFRFVGKTNYGQWLLDPAYMTWANFDVGDTAAFSRDYCFNLLLGVDARGTGPGC